MEIVELFDAIQGQVICLSDGDVLFRKYWDYTHFVMLFDT